MAELVPIPLEILLRRAFLEYRNEQRIFDLPAAKIFRGIAGLDLSVNFHGHRAATPLGPAAGPHGQMAQNIALAWLAGSRIIELKTVQILDELTIPRPCIDVANVGYNVEWSQELKLERSLEEYVKAAMLLEILQASGLAGDGVPPGFVFDMSVGYNLEGIRSPRVTGWIRSMLDARETIDRLRGELTGEWARYRGLEFNPRISDTISLSTFHGCPAGEIEGIVTYLLAELGCHVCVKLNPTLLGLGEVTHLLHDVMGYSEIVPHPPAFENDLQFDEALDLVPRLRAVARAHGRSLSLKFTNTLVVKNHKRVFTDEVMYMSGAPLHVLAMNLVKKFRAAMKEPVPMSFSGGIDANNTAAAVAMDFVPVTTCTDLLRPGGYGRLAKYLENLGAAMKQAGAATIDEFVLRYRGQEAAAQGDARRAGQLNTPLVAAEAEANPRYRYERNAASPRKVGSKLWLFDCIDCDKCVPVCPNDANFAYEVGPVEIEYRNYELSAAGVRAVEGGALKLKRTRQFANYVDACNECGNCDVFCPEDGGPFIEKARFFSSLEAYRKQNGANAFFIDCERHSIYGTLGGERYAVTVDAPAGRAWFSSGGARVEIALASGEVIGWQPLEGDGGTPRTIDMLPYHKLKLLMEAAGGVRRVNFVSAGELPPQGRRDAEESRQV